MKAVSVSRMRALIYRLIDLDDDMSDMNLSLLHTNKEDGMGEFSGFFLFCSFGSITESFA